jgi:parallel beta-helix repeat protein
VVLGVVVAGGVFTIGMLLLALVFGLLRSDRDSANQVPPSETSPEPRERIWRVGQNNLTFEQAVARAQPGDTIEVPAGRFTLTQSVLVNKSLTIRGAGPDKTTLLSWEPDFAIKFTGPFLLTGEPQWTLENLSLEHVGNKPANVVVVDSGVITIRNCHFSGAVWDETSRLGGSGIWLTGSARGVVSNCVCRNNGLHGIDVNGQAQPILEGNTCEENKGSGIAYFDSAGGTARNNTCRKNGLYGIGVSGQAQPHLEGNTCEGNKYSGIAYFDSAGGTARNNTFRNNGLHGIGVQGQAQPTLEGNTCEGNTQNGITYFDSAGGTAGKNTCRNNALHGIGVSGQAQPHLEGNTCEGNTQSGIAYFDSAGGTARNNTCRNNGEYGIYTQPGTRPILEGNREEGNKRRIWRVGQNNLTFEQAVARAQPGDTIEVPAGRST